MLFKIVIFFDFHTLVLYAMMPANIKNYVDIRLSRIIVLYLQTHRISVRDKTGNYVDTASCFRKANTLFIG